MVLNRAGELMTMANGIEFADKLLLRRNNESIRVLNATAALDGAQRMFYFVLFSGSRNNRLVRTDNKPQLAPR